LEIRLAEYLLLAYDRVFYCAVPHKVCNSKKICAVLMKKLLNSKGC